MKKVVLIIVLAGLLTSCVKEMNVESKFQLECDVLYQRTGDDDDNETAGKVKGTVTDENGIPVSGIQVDLKRVNNNFYDFQLTDNVGGFEFNSLEASDYELRTMPNTSEEVIYEITVH